MGVLGGIIGGVGGFLFGGPWGAIFGACVGSSVEENLQSSAKRRRTAAAGGEPMRVFCVTAAAMLAKMAKADGRITRDEIEAVEIAFRRLGFSPSMRTLAVKVFRQAKDDRHSIYEYAADFAETVQYPEMRILFYELLWDLACADGHVSANEHVILQHMTGALRIPPGYYQLFANERLRRDSGGGGGGSSYTQEDALADAYRQLDVSPNASDDEVKKAYRQMAKKYHPDALRAQGLPEEMIAKATERMSKINAAWAAVKSARGI